MSKKLSWFAIGVFLCVILFLNWCYQFCSDDCFYGSFWLNGVGQRLGSISNVLTVTLKDPHRPFVHFLVRMFSGCFDKWVFNVCNTLMMGLLIVLVNRLALRTWKLNVHSVILTIAMTFFVLCKGESYLWCAGSVNYLWVAVWTLGFCFIIERMIQGPCRWWQIGLFMLAAVVCGGSNETFTPPMCVAMTVVFLVKDRKLTFGKVLVGLCYVVPMVAMALFERQNRVGAMVPAITVQNLFITALKIAVTVKCAWVMALVLLFQSDKKEFFRRNALELTMVAVSCAMVMVVGFHGERTLWCANLFAMIVVVREWQPKPLFSAAATVAVVAVALCLVPYGLKIRANFSSFIARYLASDDNVTCHEFVPCGYFNRYFHQVMYQWRKPTIHSRYLARFYGRSEQPISLPRELYNGVYQSDEFCVEANLLSLKGTLKAYTMPKLNTIVIPLSQNQTVDPKSNRVDLKCSARNGVWASIQTELVKNVRPDIECNCRPQLLKTSHGDYLLVAKGLIPDECINDIVLSRCE